MGPETLAYPKESIQIENMKTPAFVLVVAASLLSGLGCQRSDGEAAHARAEQLKHKAEAAAQQLGQDAKKIGAKINEKAQEAGAAPATRSEATPEEKLKRGAAELKREGQDAGEKLSRMSQSAKVKYNLSASLGLSAVSNIDIESAGNTVTLRGRVASADQKAEAERAAANTAGVAKVINDLRVQP
jgi:osmotically-inducible protein OsmY